jgi:hypothetical protein
VGDSPIDGLLSGVKDLDSVAGQLEPLLNAKLSSLSPTALLQLVQMYVAESDPEKDAPLNLPAATRDALKAATTPEDARNRIVNYLLRDRPLAVRQTVAKAVPAWFPMVSLGVARILTWQQRGAQVGPLSAAEREVVKNLGRLAIIWAGFLQRETSDLATVLGVAVDGLLLTSEARQTSKTRHGAHREPEPGWADCCHVLRGLVDGLLHRDVPKTVAALWAYKLGLEVMLPDSRAWCLGKDELALQQEACRFLVEREIRAHGTKFGQSQVDLRAEDAFGTLIVEEKVLRDAPSERDLRLWLSQLLSYMDQEPTKNRGALLLFNTSKLALVTEGRALFVKHRVYVVAINLCEATPSKRPDAIEVLESDDPTELVRLRRPVGRRAARTSST